MFCWLLIFLFVEKDFSCSCKDSSIEKEGELFSGILVYMCSSSSLVSVSLNRRGCWWRDLLCFLIGVLDLVWKGVTALKEKEFKSLTIISLLLSFLRKENWSVPGLNVLFCNILKSIWGGKCLCFNLFLWSSSFVKDRLSKSATENFFSRNLYNFKFREFC